MTQREMYNKLLQHADLDADEIAFLKDRIAKLDRKPKVGEDGLTDKQRENIALGNKIVEFLAGVDSPVTATQIADHFDVSTQKVAPILSKIIADQVTVEVVKRVKYYSCVA